jgi:hypothetical protein
MAQPGMAPTVNTNAIVSALMGAYQIAQTALAKQGPDEAASPQALRTISAVPGILGHLAQTGAVTPEDAMSYAANSQRTGEMANAAQNDFNSRLAGAQADYAGHIYGANTALAGREYTGNLGYASHIAGAQIAAQQAAQDAQTNAFARLLGANQEANARFAGNAIPYMASPQYVPAVQNAQQNISNIASNNLSQLAKYSSTRAAGLPNMGG